MQTQTAAIEQIEYMRNIDNYNNDVRTKTVQECGINENSSLNLIKSFHVVENYCVNIMHDIFEGIGHYDLAHIIRYYIYDMKFFRSIHWIYAKKHLTYT